MFSTKRLFRFQTSHSKILEYDNIANVDKFILILILKGTY